MTTIKFRDKRSSQKVSAALEITGSVLHDSHQITALIEEDIITAILELQSRGASAELDAVLTVVEVFDDGVATPALNAEGVTTALTPDAVFAASTDEEIIAATAIKAVIAALPIESVGRAITGDFVVTGTSIDVFNGNQAVSAITSVLPASGVQIDAVGT